MNAQQIFTIVTRMVMRRVLRKGMNAGIGAVGSHMNKGKTAEECSQSPDVGESIKRAKKSMRMVRKIGRF